MSSPSSTTSNATGNSLVEASKFLSFVLRHQPSAIGLKLDAEGWANVEDLLEGSRQAGKAFDFQLLATVVATSDKQRFALSEDGSRIRANQGHSLKVDLRLAPSVPPAVLYHGTATRFVTAILAGGLNAAERNHVHLSKDVGTATQVGERHGKAVVLEIDAKRMHADGVQFYLSENGVWLTGDVPARYLRVMDTRMGGARSLDALQPKVGGGWPASRLRLV